MTIEVRKVRDHYEIWIAGVFYCSCETREEVDIELAML